ncbi:hypothetical protein DFJ73DRAFT_830054 [Zopfochytrium polystomum]|nr:hypothetical protein DFJ73DRAFT_830054 [Zopfochytrium polystomum]
MPSQCEQSRTSLSHQGDRGNLPPRRPCISCILGCILDQACHAGLPRIDRRKCYPLKKQRKRLANTTTNSPFVCVRPFATCSHASFFLPGSFIILGIFRRAATGHRIKKSARLGILLITVISERRFEQNAGRKKRSAKRGSWTSDSASKISNSLGDRTSSDRRLGVSVWVQSV